MGTPIPTWDSLTDDEVNATLRAADTLCRFDWPSGLLARTQPILNKLRLGVNDKETYRRNPISASERGFLFEIRYAAALAAAGLTAEYEHQAGANGTTVDFKVHLDPPWLIELVSLRESQAVRDATWTNSGLSGLCLSTDADDPRQSEEGEMLKAQERIAVKVWDGGTNRPIKFPVPNGMVHMIMVDARGYLGVGGGDNADWRHITLGAHGLQPEYVRYWTNQETGGKAPIVGLFETSCPLAASEAFRERVHVIGFICEKEYTQDEIRDGTFFCCNPTLVGENTGVKNAISRWPLMRDNASRRR